MEHSELVKKFYAMSTEEVYASMLSNQVYALMFHDQMASYFDFLGLNGFKRMHEYQYLSESILYRKIQRFFINRHNEIVEPHEVENPHVIPADWSKHNRKEVTPAIRIRSVKDAFEDYREWEQHTEEYLSACAVVLCDRGLVVDYIFVKELVEDVGKELKQIDRLMLELSAVDYDMTYIEEIQCKLHKKYKKKTHHVGSEL